MKNRSLRSFDFSHNTLGDLTLKYLAHSLSKSTNEKCKVKDINLSFNNFSDKEGKRLAEAISHSLHLRRLNLSNNNLSDTSANVLYKHLKKAPGITLLDLDKNLISPNWQELIVN